MAPQEIQNALNTIKDNVVSKITDKKLDITRRKYTPIHQYDLDGNYLSTFESQAHLARHLGMPRNQWSANFNDYKNGKQNAIYGFLWSLEKVDKLVRPKKYRYIIYDMENNEVMRVFNLTEFSRSLGYTSVFSMKNLQKMLRNKYVIEKI